MHKSTKDKLIDATLHLAGQAKPEATTIRAIARAVGITEGAIYRHFRGKDDLYRQAYERVVNEMFRDKERVVASSMPLRKKLYEWIRLSYAYFDAQPQAFTCVLLTGGVVPRMERGTMTKQGRLLVELIRQAQTNGEVRSISPEVALSHFTGLLLNVPRLINEGTLKGTASQYVDEVAESAWRVLARRP